MQWALSSGGGALPGASDVRNLAMTDAVMNETLDTSAWVQAAVDRTPTAGNKNGVLIKG